MWSFKLRHKHYSISIESLRRKLSPIDPSVKALLYGRLAEKAERAEGNLRMDSEPSSGLPAQQ
jgi:hypothetical protein